MLQPAYVEREVLRLQQNINAAAARVYRPLAGRHRNTRRRNDGHAMDPSQRHLIYSSHEALNASKTSLL